MRRSLPLLIGSVGLILAACSDQGPGPETTTPAVNNAFLVTNHFFFLPPLAKALPATGEFNPDLTPVVEICRLTGVDGTCTADPMITFTRGIASPFGELMIVSKALKYHIDWKTVNYTIPDYSFWRVHVRTAPGGGTLFGYVDLKFVTNTSELESTPKGTVGVVNGSVVPIGFKIEKGALCADPTTCVETSITSAGGTFTVPDGTAGLQAPAGAVDPGQTVNLVIERYTGPDPCLPVFDPQYEACYRYFTEPHVDQFNVPVILGQCLDAAGQAVYNQLALWKWDEVNPSSLVELPAADASAFITCPDNLASAARGKSGLLAGLLKPLTGLLGVKPLHAATAGPPPIGAGALDLSRVGPRRRLTISKESGDNQTATVGSAVTASVKVTSTKTGEPVSGVPVDFTALTGGAATTPGTTDAFGIASTSWTLGSVGANSLRADGKNPRPFFPGQPGVFGWVTFNATGLAQSYGATFLAPIGVNSPGTNVPGLPITVRVCEVVADACAVTLVDLPAVLSIDGTFYQADWITPTNLSPTKAYRITVLVSSVNAESVRVDSVGGGAFKVGNFQFTPGQTVPVTFRIQSL